MQKINLLTLLLLFSTFTFAQKHDYVWLFGYSSLDNPQDSVFGTSMLDFNEYGTDQFIKFQGDSEIDFDATCSSVSDSFGNYLFSYNGKYIEDASFQPMMNGMNLSESGDKYGDIFPQQSIVIPLPGSKYKYILFHQSWKYINQSISIAGFRLYYSIIDMKSNNGLGEVVVKKKLLVQDTADIGKLTATKHANGRDWWVIYPRYNSSDFQRFLVDPNGIKIMPRIKTNCKHKAGLGQAIFSPDGTKYAKLSTINESEGNFLYLYNFDRCTGTFSNLIKHHYNIAGFEEGGLAFSKNSSVLYLLAYKGIFQFDLTRDSILREGLLIDTIDSYLDTIPNSDLYFPHDFFCGQLGPDGKIYISSYKSVRVLSTIDNPNEIGQDCQLNQHSIHLPSLNLSTLSNNPNYRLGPIDGSTCDTLGNDNIPLARFRSDQNTDDFLTFDFVDLSDYEPEEWYWELGDGNTSTEINPGHTYTEPGIYEVCLTVTNDNGSDSHCKTINLATTTVQDRRVNIKVGVFPNPCSSFVNIEIANYYPKSAYINLYDTKGRLVMERKMVHGLNSLNLINLNSGIYYYKIYDDNKLLKTSKIIKQQ